jgi:hypothetical protein
MDIHLVLNINGIYLDGIFEKKDKIAVSVIQEIIEENVKYLKEEGDIPENHRVTEAKSPLNSGNLMHLGGLQWLKIKDGIKEIEIKVTTSAVGGSRRKSRKNKRV